MPDDQPSLQRPPNGGSRPVPDPTALTDQAIARAERAIREYVDSQLAIRDERLRGIDEATKIRLAQSDSYPSQMDEKVEGLDRLMAVKFDSIATQFRERDIRAEREARDNKVAVDAAFAAQKEAAAKQDEGNAKAIDKSERATAETIKTNQELTASKTDALTKGLDEVKLAVSRIESTKAGAVENRTGLYAGLAALGAVIGVVVAVVSFIATRGTP